MARRSENSTSKAASAGQCPICGKPRVAEYRPFCSKRCADIDLNRWLKGSYVIPGSVDADEDGDAPQLAANENTES
ncbi:MAG: DNA gyrase inhibitor YacG [Alphaproteobacteria bacterium]